MHQHYLANILHKHISPNKNLYLSRYWYSTEICNLFHPKKKFHSSVRDFILQKIRSFSKYLDYLYGWYDFVEGGEDKNPNISEYDTAIIKANVCSLKHLYELEISYPGFVNDK